MALILRPEHEHPPPSPIITLDTNYMSYSPMGRRVNMSHYRCRRRVTHNMSSISQRTGGSELCLSALLSLSDLMGLSITKYISNNSSSALAFRQET